MPACLLNQEGNEWGTTIFLCLVCRIDAIIHSKAGSSGVNWIVCSAGPVPSCRSPVPMPLFFSTEARQRRCDCAWEQPSRFSLGKRLGPLPPGIRAIEPYLLRCVPLLARPQTRDGRRLMREHSHRCCALCNYKTLFETLDTVCDIA